MSWILSGIFELQVTEDTIATNTQKMYLVKRQLAEERSQPSERLHQDKRGSTIHIPSY